MTNKVYYCLPTYKSFDLAENSVLAAMRSTLPPDQIIIADNTGTGEAAKYLHPLVEKYPHVYVVPMPCNNVSAAWNMFLTTTANDHVIIANDDIEVEPYTIERLVNASIQHPQEILFAGDGSSGNVFSLFLLTQHGFNTIGLFDTNFDPAYLEDNDYTRRMLLKGFRAITVQGATYFHVGSSTIKRNTVQEMDAHHSAFRANQAYYIRKWGGLPVQEIYETAFNQ